MEEIKTETKKVFEDLPKEKRKILRKEFGKCVEVHFKIFFWCGIALLLPALLSGSFSIYFMLNILFTGVVAFQLYICAAVFTVGCVVSLLLTSQYHKRFRLWLKEYKDINTRVNNNSSKN